MCWLIKEGTAMVDTKAGVGENTARKLLRSMEATQRAVAQSSRPDAEVLATRIEEWRELVEELSRDTAQRAELALLHELIRVTNTSLDLSKMLGFVLDSLIHLTGAERGCVMLLGEEGNLEIHAAQRLAQQELSDSELAMIEVVVTQAIEMREPVLTTNAHLDPRLSSQDGSVAHQLRSIVCVPLHIRGRAQGALYMDYHFQEGVFPENSLPLLTAFANQAAIAIDNAALHARTDGALAALVEELTTLQRIDRELNKSLDFERILEQTLSWGLRATGAEAGVLSVLDAGDHIRTVTASKNGLTPVAADGEEMTQAMESTEAVIFEEDRIWVPIRLEGKAIGLLDLQGSDNTRFWQEHAQFASRLADHAAIAIENARLYERIRRANQAKSEFVSFVTHELRTPMTSIRGYASLLCNEKVGPLSEKQREFAEAIHRNVDRMKVLVSDLQDISRIEAGQLQLEKKPVVLRSVLREAIQATEDQVGGQSHRVTSRIPDDLPAVLADPTCLTQILVNLLTNACKYTPEGGDIQVRAQCANGRVHCTVIDNGIGISPEDQAQLFTKFFRAECPAVQEMPGTGLGLSIVKNLVEMHGGETRVESQLGQGTSVTFSVPVADQVS
jgi:signal transduction histidine kinase